MDETKSRNPENKRRREGRKEKQKAAGARRSMGRAQRGAEIREPPSPTRSHAVIPCHEASASAFTQAGMTSSLTATQSGIGMGRYDMRERGVL